MSNITIYDTRGNRYVDGSATDESDESVKDLFSGAVRFAIETGRRLEMTVFFRAKKSENARSEQFYARFETGSEGLDFGELLRALEQTIEDDWGYVIDNSSDEMNLYRVLRNRRYEEPGTEVDHDIISTLLSQHKRPRIGVEAEDNAVGLLKRFVGDYTTAAVADSIQSSSIAGYDLVAVPGEGQGVTPLGETADNWADARESARESSLFDAVNTVRVSVNELSRTHGLSDDEIRALVFSEAPVLHQGGMPSTANLETYPTGVRQAVSDIESAVSTLSTGQGLSDAEVRQKVTQEVPTLKSSSTRSVSSTGGSSTSQSAVGSSTGTSGSYGSAEEGSLGAELGSSSSSSSLIPDDRATVLALVMVVIGVLLVGLVVAQLGGVITLF